MRSEEDVASSPIDINDVFTEVIDKNGNSRVVTNYTKLAATKRSVANYINILTGESIPVKYAVQGDSSTDGKSVTISAVFGKDDFNSVVGTALHEGSHIVHSNFDLLKGGSIKGSVFHQNCVFCGADPKFDIEDADLRVIKWLFNYVEDRRIDMIVYNAAPGYQKYYQAMYQAHWNSPESTKKLKNNKYKGLESWEAYSFYILNFTNSARDLTALKALQDIWDLIDLQNISRLQDSGEALLVACKIYLRIRKELGYKAGQPPVGTPNGTCQNGGIVIIGDATKFEDADGNIVDVGDAIAEMMEDAKSKQDFLEGKHPKEGELTSNESDIIDALEEAGTESRRVSSNVKYIPGELVTPDTMTTVIKKLTEDIICGLPDMFNVKLAQWHFGRNDKAPNASTLEEFNTTMGERNLVVQQGLTLGRRLGSKLAIRNEDRSLKTSRLSYGKVDRRLLTEIVSGNEDLFYKIDRDSFKDLFIHISIDASGSMCGEKFDKALISAIGVAKAASMTKGIRVQISLRGTAGAHDEATSIYVYDSKKDKISKIIKYFPFLQDFGMTPEGIAFESIFRDIKKDSKGDECFFINYSDGYPTNPTPNSDFDGVKYTAKIITKMKKLGIKVISYFVGYGRGFDNDDTFSEMYGKSAQYINPTNLGQVATSLNQKFTELKDDY